MVAKLEEKVLSLEEGSCMDAVILPLHGSLPPEMQARSSKFNVLISLSICQCSRMGCCECLSLRLLMIDYCISILNMWLHCLNKFADSPPFLISLLSFCQLLMSSVDLNNRICSFCICFQFILFSSCQIWVIVMTMPSNKKKV